MKFFVDPSLGKLAKWLRLAGFDTVPLRITPEVQLPLWQRGVYFLTKRAAWPPKKQRPDLIILKGQEVEQQLLELAQRLPLFSQAWEPLQRCSLCNVKLRPLPADQVEGRVPDYVANRHPQFYECPQCQRVFWEGSQQRRIWQRLQDLCQNVSREA